MFRFGNHPGSGFMPSDLAKNAVFHFTTPLFSYNCGTRFAITVATAVRLHAELCEKPVAFECGFCCKRVGAAFEQAEHRRPAPAHQ